MITYKQPIRVKVCDTYEQAATLKLIDYQNYYGEENDYSIWELKIVSQQRFIEPMPFKSISISKYVDAFDVVRLVNFLRNPQKAFNEVDKTHDSIYANHSIQLRRFPTFSTTIFNYTFYSEYNGVYFVVKSEQLTNCFPEVLTRQAINAL